MTITNALLGRRGLGWIANPPDRRDLDLDLMGLSTEKLPDSVSLRRFVPNVLDQKSTNSCVAHGIAGAIEILEEEAGLGYMPPSRLFLYFNSRAYHGGQKSDSGTFLRTAVKGLTKFGVPDERHWSFSSNPLKVNRRPSWNPYMMAHSRCNGEYYWIFGNENARIVSIKSALNAGLPVCFGTIIYDAVLKTDGIGPVDKPVNSSSYLGGHVICIVGYEQNSSGLKFEILNSWGKDWGDGGFGWFTEDYIRWSLSRDFVIIKGWRRLRKEDQ